MLFEKKNSSFPSNAEIRKDVEQEYRRLFASYIRRKGSTELLNYLGNNTDFFDAPASTKYHGNFKGGLCLHSINVAKELIKSLYREGYIKKGDKNEAEKIESAYLVALTHDLCKCNFYSWGTRNIKDENGRWITAPYIEVNENFPFGHGEKSVYIVSKFISLTDEEAIAVRWRMGDYSEANGACSRAFNIYPLALFLHQADERAASLYEKTYDYVNRTWKGATRS